MKFFTKLTLVAAIAGSSSAFAMQAMDEAALSDTTGQDGITILISSPNNTTTIDQVALFDGDGLTGVAGATALEAGAIVIGKYTNVAGGAAGAAPTSGTGIKIVSSGATTLRIDTTGGGAAGVVTGAAPMLNVAIALPTTTTITTGDIGVAGAQGAAGAWKVDTNTTTGKGTVNILKSMDIGINNAKMNIQLGTVAQGAMIVASASITGGLTIGTGAATGGLSLHDGTLDVAGGGGFASNTANNGGDLYVSKVTVADTGTIGTAGAVLTTNANIIVAKDVGSALTGTASGMGGLIIAMGATTPKTDVYLQGITLGSSTSTLGDVGITGLSTAGTNVVIQGH